MSSHHPTVTEPDSAPNSVASTPRADPTPPPPPPPARWQHDDASDAPRVRLMCSFGGRILPRPHDNQLRYVGGDTRIVAVHRPTTFSALHDKLAKLAGAPDVTIKYQLPNEDLDSLISVTTDDDVENMMEEFDRLAVSVSVSVGGTADRATRLRLFLFPPSGDEGGFGSVLDGATSKNDSWFLDVLNGGAGRLERGRSEASSIVSEVPDYLFGLDNNSDEPKAKSRMAHEIASDPGSPVPAALSPKYSSAPSAVAPPSVPPIPDLPPVRTKPLEPQVQVQQQAAYAGNPVWQYVQQQEPVPVYYLPPGPVTQGNIPVQYFNHPLVAGAGGQIPAGYRQPVQGVWSNSSHARPVYVGGPAVAGVYDYPPAAMMGEAYEVAGGGGLMRNPGAGGVIQLYPAGDQPPPPPAAVPDMRIGRASQGQGQGH